MPGVVLRIVDPTTGRELPAGEVGEVWAGGVSLMDGLYKQERDATFTPDGFYRTGDLAALEPDGLLRFSSRLGEMIKISGANVAPLEVEIAMNGLPQVERSAVVTLTAPDGEALLGAAIQVRPGCDFDDAEVRRALKDQLSAYKVPKRIFALPAQQFPLTASGKIHKPQLIAILNARMLRGAG
jgi:acyl-CoA synthetase (AMP-forming)/AMP-acid ligase II